jgi:hypothetical protein
MGAEEERRGETVGVGVLMRRLPKMEGKKSCRTEDTEDTEGARRSAVDTVASVQEPMWSAHALGTGPGRIVYEIAFKSTPSKRHTSRRSWAIRRVQRL